VGNARLIFDTASQVAEKNNENSEGGQRLSHFNNDFDVFGQYPELTWLKEEIEKSADFVYQKLLNYKQSGAMKVSSAWFNLAQVGAAQTRHAHANSLLSGTLYLNTDVNTSITFYHPRSAGSPYPELFDQAVQSRNEYGLRYHFDKVEVTVKQGECLFWPSQLLHGYENNKTPNRLSFSFNLMPERMNSVYQVSASNN